MAPSNSELVQTAITQVRKVMRSRFDKSKGPVPSLEPRQKASLVDRGPPDYLWTSRFTLPAPPENDARDAIEAAVAELGDSRVETPQLTNASVVAEWVAVKRGKSKAVDDSAEARYDALSQEVSSGCTIIFVHGGAFYSNGLGSARPTAAKLSDGSGGRVISFDYRLAPQTAFPNQILDLLVLYLSLLHPPAGSFHGPISASSIVLAGESSGACIVLGFIQALRHMQSKPLAFHGQCLDPVPMPAGTALLCPQTDLALCLPSWERNREFDIWAESAPYLDPTFPADSIWPSDPPREEFYCPASYFAHPMVGSCTAESWKGAPPMWLGVGQERLVDAQLVIAQTAARQGVVVAWDQYEKMPHCWPFLMPKFPHSKHLYGRWSLACKKMAEGIFESRGCWIEVEGLEERGLDVMNLTELTPGDVRRMISSKANTMRPFKGKAPTGHL